MQHGCNSGSHGPDGSACKEHYYGPSGPIDERVGKGELVKGDTYRTE